MYDKAILVILLMSPSAVEEIFNWSGNRMYDKSMKTLVYNRVICELHHCHSPYGLPMKYLLKKKLQLVMNRDGRVIKGLPGDTREFEAVLQRKRWTREIRGMEGLDYSRCLNNLNLYSVKERLLRHGIIRYLQIFHGHLSIS